MNKSELCAEIAAKTGLTKKDAEKFTGAFVETVVESMKKGDRVQIVGFGSFEVRERPARTARNPRTGETISIEASKAPVFKAGKTFRESLN
ncbi:MAG TPA: HU family DNA-binding protein [Candidatus Aphodomonas merdavium]|nr:HU family DNA-binding protein [Candidatus Aphodomonas merdavium]